MLLQNHVFRLLIAVFAVWGALFYSSIASTVAIWYRSETFAHCFIILPICIYVIKQKWPVISKQQCVPNYSILLLMVPVLALWLFGTLAQMLVIEQGAAFLMLPLMIWAVLGNKLARSMAFALIFWMFSVPAGEFLIPQLQELTADITVWAIQLTDIPVYREGLYIAIPSGLFEVAVACSGIRYLIASFTLGTLFAYLNYQSTKKRIVFILFSLALPLIANGIRAYGIVMIAHLSDMKYATGVDHLIYGWLFFGVVILIMFSIGNIWSEPAPDYEKLAESEPAPQPNNKELARGGIAAVAVVALAISYGQFMENPVAEYQPEGEQFFAKQADMRNASWLPIFVKPDFIHQGNDGTIDFYLAYYKQNKQGAELISSANKMFNFKTWSIVKTEKYENFTYLEIIDTRGVKRGLVYSFVTPWLVSSSQIKVKLLQAIQAFMGVPQAGLVMVMSLQLSDDENGQKKILLEKANQRFVAELSEQLNAR